jgi:FdhD protein
MSIVDIPIIRYENGQHASTHDNVAAEEPLEIFINDKPFHMTMRLPGEEIPLAVGFLFTEGLINLIDEVLTVSHCKDVSSNRINIYLKVSQNNSSSPLLTRRSPSYSSCGICGKDLISDLSMSLPKIGKTIAITFPRLAKLQDMLMKDQQIFRNTGGTHAAGIFNEAGTLLGLSEDIGRHNALDKAIGKILLTRKTAEAKILILSSRLSYEMVTKAARLGIEIITGVSSATSLAIDLAQNVEMTLIGFHRGQRGNIYTCSERIILEDQIKSPL